jgi:hypothetical protein
MQIQGEMCVSVEIIQRSSVMQIQGDLCLPLEIIQRSSVMQIQGKSCIPLEILFKEFETNHVFHKNDVKTDLKHS